MDRLSLKSTADGTVLTFKVTAREAEETRFDVEVHTGAFNGCTTASTYHNGAPSRLFQAMAAEWKGWAGEKKWGDLDHYVALTATSDSTGHIRVQIDLADDAYETRLRAVLLLYAGELERISADLCQLFGERQ